MISRAVVDLPQPDSPTIPSVSPCMHVEDDAVDGVHRADLLLEEDPVGDREVLARGRGPRAAAPLIAGGARVGRRVGARPAVVARRASTLAPAVVAHAARLAVAPAQLGRRWRVSAGSRQRRDGPGRRPRASGGSIALVGRQHVRAARVEVRSRSGGEIRLGGRPGIGTSSSPRDAVEPRDRLQQPPRVRMLGRGEDRLLGSRARRPGPRTSPRCRRRSRRRRRGRA